jgi:transposase
MSDMPPILIAGLFRELSPHLLALLRSLSNDEWHLPTSSSQRNVKDVASHLLDGALRRLSGQRDGYRGPNAPAAFASNAAIVDFLNRINDDWTLATRRLSPRVLVELIEWSEPQICDLFESLDPFGPGIPVAWAGEKQSACWLDLAREYTERWHHTQQIFAATGRPSTIAGRRLFHPCLDTFMRALPHTYRDVAAPEGTLVKVVITGDAGGDWFLLRQGDQWRQAVTADGAPSATITMTQDEAWRLVTKRRSREQAEAEFAEIRIAGDRALGSPIFGMLAMMA